MAIDMVKIRARITIGSLEVQTPYIQSFSVNQTRGQISTFSAQMKVPSDDVRTGIVGEAVVIEAGEDAPENVIFAGLVKDAKMSPVFDDPAFVVLSINGSDILTHLEGKRYTRRCRATNATWVSIDSVTRKGLRTGKFKARKSESIYTTDTFPLETNSTDNGTGTTPTDTFESAQIGVIQPQPEGLAQSVVIKSTAATA